MSDQLEIRSYNREAWNREVEHGNRWTQLVAPGVIARARAGDWSVLLTECKPVPRHWFPTVADSDLLCLASGGGQQGPILAAAGARVTVLDNSPRQLAQDRFVAERDHLSLQLIEGDMADLSALASESFDIVFHPVSNSCAPQIRPVWKEAFRVLRPGGSLLAGFLNPLVYLFDIDEADRDELVVRHPIHQRAISRPTWQRVPSSSAIAGDIQIRPLSDIPTMQRTGSHLVRRPRNTTDVVT